MNNYTVYHLHSELSLLDSTTNYKDYILRAKDSGQKAICFTEHGNTYNWVEKKMFCEMTHYKVYNGDVFEYTDAKHLDKVKQKFYEIFHCDPFIKELPPIKYIHGVEVYLTETLDEKIKDNYHTILIAKNYQGLREINVLIDLSTTESHMYYKPRISFEEFMQISDNVIKTSACLASPLWKLYKSGDPHQWVERLLPHYDFLEVQPHNCPDQKEFNIWLYNLSRAFDIPLIAGTDTHSISQYKAECRTMLQYAKNIDFGDEDAFDLTWKSYDELVHMFEEQGALPEQAYLEAIENTNRMADSVEDFHLDLSFKYPKLYDNEEEVFVNRIKKMYWEKVNAGIIEDDPVYETKIREELRVLKKIGMIGFMLFMSELVCWCHENNIPTGPCRGSVGGSTVAYITGIIDVNPVIWNTVFSRFANEDRMEIGDIDLDFAPNDREAVYNHIFDQFTDDYASYIMTTTSIHDKGTIDEIVRGLQFKWAKDHGKNLKNKSDKSYVDKHCPYSLKMAAQIKKEFSLNPDEAREKWPDIFYYFDGMNGVVIARGVHPAGIVVSPVTLSDNYGTFWVNGHRVLSINMEEIHEINLVKYDILGLKNVGIIKDCCKLIGIPYLKAHELDWNDQKVWDDILCSPAGIFQMEGDYAFELLKKYKPQSVDDLSLVNAALRPSGASYRDRLLARIPNKNPSKLIDDLLAPSYGYLVFQEQTTQFLTDICGLSGSEGDNVRRAIGRKNVDRLKLALPQILDGYCKMSPQPREIAEEEAKAFIQIIEDSSNYQFGLGD